MHRVIYYYANSGLDDVPSGVSNEWVWLPITMKEQHLPIHTHLRSWKKTVTHPHPPIMLPLPTYTHPRTLLHMTTHVLLHRLLHLHFLS